MSHTHKQQHIVLGLLITLLISFTFVQAQPFRMSVQDRVQLLKDSLKLSSEQEKKITEILTAQQTEMQQKRNELQGDREASRTYMMEHAKKTDEQIKAVLTKEQAQKYDSMMKARREQMRKRAPRGNQ